MARNLEAGENEESERGYSTPCKMPMKCCKDGPIAWCKKYFWEGQLRKEHSLQDKREIVEEKNNFLNLLLRYRRLLGFILPATIFHLFWWPFMIKRQLWEYFVDKWYMSLTMAVGSMVAGMTSEGGGAVAFPVMTIAFKIEPSVARDFSLMIQSCGMTAATLTILIMGIHLEWNSLVWSTVGGAIGVILGLEFIDPYLTPPQKKMGFVSIWFSFAFALFLLNRYHKRQTFTAVHNLNLWKIVVLVLTGVVGGMFTSFSGSGLDICSFSILTLLFRVSEKVATPTSVILMAGNTLVGFYWRDVMMQAITQEAWEFFTVCIPIVVLGAPFGSLLGSHFHRLVLASFVYILDTAALVGAFFLVPQTPILIGLSLGIIIFGFFFFLGLTKCGHVMLRRNRAAVLSSPSTNSDTGSLENYKETNDDLQESPLLKVNNQLKFSSITL